MKYIIVEMDKQISNNLYKILVNYEILDFKGSFTTQEKAESSIREAPPDIAFIRIGDTELNAFKFAAMLHQVNPLTKIIFISSSDTYAIEAFECEGEGYLMIPFDEEKIEKLMAKILKKTND